MTLLEYNKMILDKLSFDPSLFLKELRKAIRFSTLEDSKKLVHYCKQKYRSIMASRKKI